MQFKHPEILYFLFLLVIPIIVHLFQLRRFKKEYFTNVRILKELSIQTRKSSKLKKWLLLATRCLLLAALIIAFAQPFFNAKDSKNVTNELYIILDNSFSMQAKGKKGELLKRTIENLLEQVPENQSFSLITNSETYWDTDIKSIRKDLQNLTYSPTAFSPESIMAKVKARKSVYNKDIIVITDAVGLGQKQSKSFKTDFNTMFIIPEAEQKSNVSADSVYIKQTLENFYEIGLKLSSFGSCESAVPVALYNKNKLIAKTQVTFDTKNTTISFTIPKEEFHGFFQISDNRLPYDNVLYFSISKPEKIKVLCVGDPVKSAFLSKIYTAAEFTYNSYTLASLDYNLLEKQDAVVLNELADIPQALHTTLKSFVEKGGNLVIIPAPEANVSNLNTTMAIFGNVTFSPLLTIEKTITKIAFGHPLYRSVFEKKIDNFQYPKVKSTFPVGGNAPAALSFDDQSAFLKAVQNPLSSVYVFAAPINKDNSNFQNSPLIVPTFYNMAQLVGKTSVSSLTIGENLPILIDVAISKDEIVNIRNSEQQFIPVQQVLNNKVKLTFADNPTKAGNFTVFKKEAPLKNISFNYGRSESDLTSPNNALLDDFKVVDNLETVFNTLQTNRTNNEIWKWFVILALLFLLSELLIQKFVK